jgi:23S rRNA (guanosine2251-2'-O)-methyltransferase
MNLICGVNPVLEALAAGTRHFDRLLVVKGLRGKRLAEAIRRATRLGIPIRFEMRETLDRHAGGVPHQGIIAVVSEKPVLSLETLLAGVREPALLVVLDGVEDPRNLGAVLRTAEAAGADGVLLPERHSAGLSETVARASAGAIEHVKVARVGNLVQALEALKQRGIWIVGYDASGSERWDAVDLTHPVALVLGGEGRGMRRLVREHCDHLVSIPHFGHVTSLNVSVAAGVALYEAVRQRRAIPSIVRPIPRAASVPQVVGPGPDDVEDDDALGSLSPTAAPAEAEVDDGDDLDTPAIPHVDFHEDVAWGRGPTVLKPIDFQRALRGGDRAGGRRDKSHRRRPRADEGRREASPRTEPAPPTPPDGEPGAPAPAAASPASAPGGGESRRRRRRKRRGPREDAAPQGPGGAPGAEAQGARPRPPEGTSAAPRETGAGSAEGGAQPGRRRRRRRRR